MFGDSSTSNNHVADSIASPQKSLLTRGFAVVCAIGLTAAVMIGYSYLRWRHAQRVRADEAANVSASPPIKTPQAQLFVDEAMIKGSKAIIAGTIQNISQARLTNLSVVLQLKRRKDAGSELRTVPVVPRDLEPNAQGRYSLDVLSSEFTQSHVLLLKSGNDEIPFKNVPGAQRPNEPSPTGKSVIVRSPPKRSNGEEFINTPDTPVKVP